MSSGFVHEEEVNIRLADALNELGLDCRPERVSGKRRPDIRCFYNGLIIGIEASYKDRDAEEDAGKRIDQGIVDLAIALHYPVRYPNILKDKLIEQIKQSQFNVKIITPKYVKVSSLLQFINQQLGTGRPLVTSGWFTVDIPTLTNVIRHATDYLIQESEIEEEIEKIKHVINNNFVNSLRGGGGVYREIYDVMYRLYGMQSPPTDEDLVLAQAALSLLLTATFYEHVRNIHTRLSPLDSYVRRYGPIEALRKP
ncbi:hypothetical protein [Vulcanisaeta distributa]|uniref:hypothetical protein n=1 Tax=Vulcanisaeta distributa TaxID=164451 RepID=UPI0006CF5683|nr:hypothetical protein [Vulcanisaeta distributa]